MKRFLILLFLTSTLAASQDFDQAVQEVYRKKPHLRAIAQRKQRKKSLIKKKSPKLETLHKVIDLTTIGYILVRSYLRYQEIYGEGEITMKTVEHTPLWWILNKLPGQSLFNFVKRIGKNGLFTLDIIGTSLQAVIAKSLAKFIILCSTGDIVDVAEEAVVRSKRMIKKVLG